METLKGVLNEARDLAVEQYDSNLAKVSSLTGGRVDFGLHNAEAPLLRICKRVVELRTNTKVDKPIISSVVNSINYEASTEVQFQGLLAMATLVADEENLEVFMEKDIVPRLVTLAGSQEERVQYAAGRCLLGISKSDKHRATLVEKGVLDAIARMADSTVAHNQYCATKILSQLCQQKAQHEPILASTLPYTITRQLLKSESEEVLYGAATAMQRLAHTAPEHAAFVDEDFVSQICKLAYTGTDNIKYAAFTAIRSFTAITRVRKRFVDAGIVDSLKAALKSEDARVKYISQMTLSEVVECQPQLGEICSSAFTNLDSDDINVRLSAAHLIRKFIAEPVVRDEAKKRDFGAMVMLLENETTARAGFLVLGGILQDYDVAERFVRQGFVSRLVAILELQNLTQDHAAAGVLLPLTFAGPHNNEIIAFCSDNIARIASQADAVDNAFLGCLLLAMLNPRGTDFTPITNFLKANDHKTTTLTFPFSQSELNAISTMFDRTSTEGQSLAVWCFAYLSHRDASLFGVANGYDTLQKFATSSQEHVSKFATSALVDLDTADEEAISHIPDDQIQEQIDQFFASIKEEGELVKSLKQQRNVLEDCLVVRYRKRENVDKIPLCDPKPFFPENVNTKLGEVAAVRSKIDFINTDLVSQLHGVSESLGPLTDKLDGLGAINNRSSDQAKVEDQRRRLADINKQIVDISKKLEQEFRIKRDYETQKAELVAKQAQKTVLENKRVELIGQLEDLNYQLNNFDKTNQGAEKESDDLKAQIEQLKKRIAELEVQRDELVSNRMGKAKEAIVACDAKMTKYEELRSTAAMFKQMRSDLKAQYGERLHDMDTFHVFLNSLVDKGFQLLRELGKHDVQQPPTGERDFGGKAEVILHEKISELYSELEAQSSKARRGLVALEDECKSMDSRLDSMRNELEKLKSRLQAFSAQRGTSTSKSDLQLKKRMLDEEIHKLNTQIQALIVDLGPINQKIEDQAKTIAKDQAHKRKLEGEARELQRQIDSTQRALKGDISLLQSSLSEIRSGRAAVQAKIRPLQAAVEQWKKLFPEEKTLSASAETALALVMQDLISIHSGVKNMKEDILLVEQQ